LNDQQPKRLTSHYLSESNEKRLDDKSSFILENESEYNQDDVFPDTNLSSNLSYQNKEKAASFT